MDIYIEAGQKRVFAGALEWPGWCRRGNDEQTAIHALRDYWTRYRKAIRKSSTEFPLPRDLVVVERLKGDATTDFGTPGAAPRFDAAPMDESELERLVQILEACWSAFDSTAKKAGGKTLTTGPRGGGRDIDRMRAHVLEGQHSYLVNLGGRFRPANSDVGDNMKAIRKVFVETLQGRLRGEIPDAGPKGGRRWSPRYAIRRSAWHSLDHAWEIEDRA